MIDLLGNDEIRRKLQNFSDQKSKIEYDIRREIINRETDLADYKKWLEIVSNSGSQNNGLDVTLFNQKRRQELEDLKDPEKALEIKAELVEEFLNSPERVAKMDAEIKARMDKLFAAKRIDPGQLAPKDGTAIPGASKQIFNWHVPHQFKK